MRTLIFIPIFIILPLFLAAQRIEGRVVGPEGNGVDYVSIGLSGTRASIVSDGRGVFSMVVPDSLSGRGVVFSHVSYEPLTVPAPELIRRAAGGERIEIVLTPRIVELPDVVVTSRKARYKRVGASHLSALTRVRIVFISDDQQNFSQKADSKAEIISVLHIRQPMRLEEISFAFVRMPHDSLLVRLNLYAKRGNDFIPIHSKPIYSMVPTTAEKRYYHLDVSGDRIVVEPGVLYAGLEVVRCCGHKKDQKIEVPAHWGAGYVRSGVDVCEKVPIHAGIQVYGLLLQE